MCRGDGASYIFFFKVKAALKITVLNEGQLKYAAVLTFACLSVGKEGEWRGVGRYVDSHISPATSGASLSSLIPQ